VELDVEYLGLPRTGLEAVELNHRIFRAVFLSRQLGILWLTQVATRRLERKDQVTSGYPSNKPSISGFSARKLVPVHMHAEPVHVAMV
jgi:hypothetical protein